MPSIVLPAAMGSDAVPEWPGSTWVGAIDVEQSAVADIRLDAADGYPRGRLLVRRGRLPLGFVEFEIRNGAVPTDELRRAIERLPRAEFRLPDSATDPISVVLCTRDRPSELRSAIASLLKLNYPDFEIVIVDNASRTNESEQVVAGFDDQRLRLVSEPRPGLARARNRGVIAASHDIVAFTDDDVVVDSNWLLGLTDGFAASPDVACVCGIVPSGELRSFSQAYFDGRVTWARSCVPNVYRLSEPPRGQALFPFQVGQYGTGANFAMRRSIVFAVGGFDEALGVGSPSRGGEDIDMFVRVILAGYALAYQPTALVWHRHRADMSSLHEQIAGYGVGLGAWIGKLLVNRRTAPMVVRRAFRGVLHARRMTVVDVEDGGPPSAQVDGHGLAATELRGALRGPWAYLRARRAGASKAPLHVLAAEAAASRPDVESPPDVTSLDRTRPHESGPY